MGEDIVPEKIKEEVHSEVKCVGSAALSAVVIASSEEFENKWFGKIKDHLCPSERAARRTDTDLRPVVPS